MPGDAEGEFESNRDWMRFLQEIMNKATNWDADNWSNPEKSDTIAEQMDSVIAECKLEYREGYRETNRTAIQINRTIVDYAIKPLDFEWGWWREGELLEHADRTPIGNGKPELIETRYLSGAAIIKHDYLGLPSPVELDTVKFKQNGMDALMGTAKAGVLDSICSVPWMDPKMSSSDFGMKILDGTMDKQKWQRVVNNDRIKQIRLFAEQDDTNLLNPVLLYVDRSSVSVEDREGDHCLVSIPFTFLKERFGVFTDYFPLPEDVDTRPIWIIDGQHRIRGFGSSKSGSLMRIPFVLILGDGSVDKISKVAKLFTEINTKSEELGKLHKIFLNYRYGMVSELGDFTFELENGQPKLDSNGIPIPTESGRSARRSYELALEMASIPDSPIFNCIEFQNPPGKGVNARYVSDAHKWLQTVTTWYTNGIFSDESTDDYSIKETLNFFLAFKNICDSWPTGGSRWETGATGKKQLLQQKSSFPVLLDILSYSVEKLEAGGRPVSVNRFEEFLKPIQWVDWRHDRIKKSRLAGQNNTSWKHLKLWIKTAIENGVSYDSNEILNNELESKPGKGIIAHPEKQVIRKHSPESFPDMRPLILKIKIPVHCTSLKWEVEAGNGEEYTVVDEKCLVTKQENDLSFLTIKRECIGNSRKIKVRVKFTNGMGDCYSKEKKFEKSS